MLIQPRLPITGRAVSLGYDIIERSFHWQNKSFRYNSADANSAAILLYNYLYSYRQRENVSTKMRFWRLYENFYQSLERLHNMPRQTTTRRENAAKQGDIQFLNLRLTDEQFTELDTLKATPAQMMTALAAAVESGLGFSLSYNSEKETANATFMDKRTDSPAKGYALSAFGENVPDALKILLYKHANILATDWTSLIGEAPKTNRRG